MSAKKQGCENGCSFFKMKRKFEALSPEKQIEIEKVHQSGGDLSKEQLRLLFEETQIRSCIGGLISNNTVKNTCEYFKEYPESLDDSELTNNFISLLALKKSTPWKIATLTLSVFSLFLGVAIFSKPTNEELENTLSDLKNELIGQSNENFELENTMQNLENEIARLNSQISNNEIDKNNSPQ